MWKALALCTCALMAAAICALPAVSGPPPYGPPKFIVNRVTVVHGPRAPQARELTLKVKITIGYTIVCPSAATSYAATIGFSNKRDTRRGTFTTITNGRVPGHGAVSGRFRLKKGTYFAMAKEVECLRHRRSISVATEFTNRNAIKKFLVG